MSPAVIRLALLAMFIPIGIAVRSGSERTIVLSMVYAILWGVLFLRTYHNLELDGARKVLRQMRQRRARGDPGTGE